MSGGVLASVVAPHTPRIGIEEKAPPFARGLIDGLRELGGVLRARKPDLFVLQSAHWVSTFNWYVTTQERHEGTCIADEAPDLIPGLPYSRPGDPGFARALAGKIQDAGLPCGLNGSPHFVWDYGSLVPLQYIDPQAEVPVVLLPTVICADLDESLQVGRLTHEAARETGRRAVFISSCALAHQVRRGPELWPSEEHQALDRRLIELMTGGAVAELIDWAPQYCRQAVAEMDGRTLGGMLGAMQAMAGEGVAVQGRQFGPYAQSSGSGNAALCVMPRDT